MEKKVGSFSSNFLCGPDEDPGPPTGTTESHKVPRTFESFTFASRGERNCCILAAAALSLTDNVVLHHYFFVGDGHMVMRLIQCLPVSTDPPRQRRVVPPDLQPSALR